VEVHLDQPAREMDQDPRGRDEPQRRERRPEVAAQAGDPRAGSEARDHGDLGERVQQPVPGGDADHVEGGDVEPHQGEDRPMPARP
jgi:hypothetical protein